MATKTAAYAKIPKQGHNITFYDYEGNSLGEFIDTHFKWAFRDIEFRIDGPSGSNLRFIEIKRRNGMYEIELDVDWVYQRVYEESRK
jgi:hypothetical protein